MVIGHFLAHNWLDLILATLGFFLLTAKILPPRLAGLLDEFYDTQQNKMVKQPKESILDAVTRAVFFSFMRSLLITVGFRGATTIIIFAVVGVELFYNKTISTNAVIIAIAGILALHFEYVIENADEISIWKVFKFKKK